MALNTLASAPTVVVGAGIIGAAVAFELQRRGQQIVLVDRDEPGRGASFGNMASIAVTEFLPSSRPSIWSQIPRWMLDPQGPVRLRPSYLPRLTPWFLRFMAAGRPSRVRELESAGAALCKRVYDDLMPMLSAIGATDMLSTEGCLSLYADDAELAADREHLEVIERFGIAHQVLDADALRALEPGISRDIRHAVLFPENRTVRDPYRLVLALVQRFCELGGQLASGNVMGFERSEGRITALRLDGGRRIPAATLVLCAGAYTGRLSKLLDEAIPMETERGYHTQIMVPGTSLRHSLIWPARAFMVSPTAGGIRVGGTVEMAGLDAPPDYRRAKVLVERAKQALPGLEAREATEWMGHRPALPDTVPVMGPSAKTRGVFYAAGHGHLGLTYSATTARLMADLITGARPPIDMRPYRVSRF
ncbi:NAD(P)/FAD-dependent oxidoreductase [Azohydromonas aeria]|uniref:NAD(P)/FAD-dependent oxidoreductase n=1 Tax=Azohydromonas aeria TaxID=2590212 RepID=UPI0012F83719|nr:FAD-binding oxidoreductase [Azohydromonas aeria]